MKTVIEMAREAGIEWDFIDKDEGQIWYITQAGLVRFAELVRADEREALIGLLKGIDKTEIESADGWWETSSGAALGS